MKVHELMDRLKGLPAEARVVFDTDAALFRVHLVDVDSVAYEPEVYDVVTLGSLCERDLVDGDGKIYGRVRGA